MSSSDAAVRGSRVAPLSSSTSSIRLDEFDVKILQALVRDARLSNRALAREVGMSPPGVADRVGRLEAAGVIRGYRVELDYAALSRPMTVIIEVVSERSATQLELAEELIKIPEIERVEVITGTSDLQVHLRVRDQAHLNEVLFDSLLAQNPDIRHTNSYLALLTFEPESFDARLLDTLASEQDAPHPD
jgi:DNA-binding Lrp family transcriptional regulator